MIRVFIADDHAVVRRGLQLLLEGTDEMKVVGTASDGREALGSPALDACDAVVLDLSLPKVSGPEALRRVKAEHPGVAVVVLSMHPEDQFARRALADYRVVGVTTNIDFLSRLVACPAFASADLDTGLIERSRSFLFPEAAATPKEVLQVAAVGELLYEAHQAREQAKGSGDPWSPWHARDGWRLNLQANRMIGFRDGEALVEVQVAYGRDHWQLSVQGETVLARGRKLDGDRFAVELDDRRLIASVIATGTKRHVFLNGQTWVVERDDPLHLVEAGGAHGGGLTAPMPGKVVALLAQPGAKVEKGAPLLILEAMKMEHTITAPKNGTVKAFCYAAGDQVADGASLVEFEEEK